MVMMLLNKIQYHRKILDCSNVSCKFFFSYLMELLESPVSCVSWLLKINYSSICMYLPISINGSPHYSIIFLLYRFQVDTNKIFPIMVTNAGSCFGRNLRFLSFWQFNQWLRFSSNSLLTPLLTNMLVCCSSSKPNIFPQQCSWIKQQNKLSFYTTSKDLMFLNVLEPPQFITI